MRKIDLTKILCGLFFLALAGFSCFWTAESLFIWQPSITKVGAWLIAIIFYVVASLCFTKVHDALDRKTDFYGKIGGRGGAFTIGILGLLVFWIMVSLPTNTHTLLYRASIKNIITTDLTRTQGYLQGLKDNNKAIAEVEAKYEQKEQLVKSHIARMLAEIDNPDPESYQIGIGPRFKKIVAELNKELGVSIQMPDNVGRNKTQWLVTINYIQEQANTQLAIFREDANKRIDEIKRMMGSSTLDGIIENHNIALADINNMRGVNNDIISAAVDDLTNGYSVIKTNKQYIDFKDNDERRYTRDGAMPEAKEMLSVPDVWMDYLTTDKYDGHGFIWWVFIALLVDLAAFIFFDIAARKNNNAI